MEGTAFISPETCVTGDDVLAHPEWEPCELVRGKVLFMSPAGAWHGSVAAKILIRLGGFVESHSLGEVFSSETGFIIERNPDTVRGPDAMFLSKSRILPGVLTSGFLPVSPDLAVEVLSPSDSFDSMEEKVDVYLRAGVRLVWVVDPSTKTARSYRAGRDVLECDVSKTIPGEDVLPGFELKNKDLF